MTALPDTNRTRLASVRRVLAVAWRCLDLASRVWVAIGRALFLIAGIAASGLAIRFQFGRWIGLLAAVAWVLVGAAVIVAGNRRDRRWAPSSSCPWPSWSFPSSRSCCGTRSVRPRKEAPDDCQR